MRNFVGNLIFNAGQHSQFTLYGNFALVCIIDHLAGQGRIFFKRVVGSIEHYRGKAGINAGFGQFKAVAVIQMQGNWDVGAQRPGHLHGPHGHVRQKYRVGILAGTAGHLQNHRRF